MSPLTIQNSLGEAPAAALTIRRKVFVEEQGVASDEEWDEHDAAGAATLHFVALESRGAVGCARLRACAEGAKLERLAVLPEQRGRGLGRALVEAAERAAWQRGCTCLVLHAQLPVIPFYERLGWRALGPEFSEAGIPHRRMEKPRPAGA
jgi:predicted GNAT family N-acyltransferase